MAYQESHLEGAGVGLAAIGGATGLVGGVLATCTGFALVNQVVN